VEKSYPVRAMLLASAAVQALQRAGDPVDSDVEQTLRDLVGSHGGLGLPGHRFGVADLAFSPGAEGGGSRLATAGKERTIRLWDLTRGGQPDRLGALHLNTEPARIAFGPRGLLAAGGRDGTVELWTLGAADAVEATTAHLLPGSLHGPVASLAFSPDGQWLAAGGQSRSVQLWRLDPAGRLVAAHSLPGHGVLVAEVAFSPDSRWLATVDGYDGMLRLWDLQAADPAAQPSVIAAGERAMEILFDPQGRWVATGHYTGEVRLWPLSPAGVAPQPRELAAGIDAVYSIAVDPAGRWLAAAGHSGAVLWDLSQPDPAASRKLLIDQGRDVGAIPGEFMLAKISPDGRWLLITKANQGLLWKLRDAGPGYDPDVVLAGHEDTLSSAAFSADSQWLATATGSLNFLKEDAVPRLWNLSSGAFDASPREERSDLASLPGVQITADRRHLVTLAADGGVTAWTVGADRALSRPQNLLRDPELAQLDGVSSDLQTLTAAIKNAPNDPRVLLRREASGGSSKELLTCDGIETDRTAVSPDGHWIAGGTVAGDLCLWDRRSAAGGRRLLVQAPGARLGRAIVFSNSSRWLAASRGGTLLVWDLRDANNPGAGRELPGNQIEIGAIAFSPDGRWLVAGDRKGGVLLREWRDGAGEKAHRLPGHTDLLRAFAFSPKGRWLASAGYDRRVRLWDLSAPEPERTGRALEGHTHYVLALAFSADERLLLSGSLDSTIRLWNLTGRPISSSPLPTLGSWATDLVPGPANRWLLAALDTASGPSVQVFDLGLSDLLAAARKCAGRNLTQREWEQYFPDQPFGKTFPDLPAPAPPKVE
jgi:WD40 repeat protein